MENLFTLWNAHKVYIRGILIQGAKVKRCYDLHLHLHLQLIAEIHSLETSNKLSPSPTITTSLQKVREELRILLMQQYDKHLRCLKRNLYANANHAGKLLANRVKPAQLRSRTQYLIHPTTKHNIISPPGDC